MQKLLGKGSYGTVYRVKRLSDGGIYALKEADVKKMSQVERMDAVNEIRLLASVKHPNVIKYNEAFLDGKRHSSPVCLCTRTRRCTHLQAVGAAWTAGMHPPPLHLLQTLAAQRCLTPPPDPRMHESAQAISCAL